MSRKKITFVAAIAMGIIAIAVVARSQESNENATPAYGIESYEVSSNPSDNWMEVEESWIIADEPQEHFTKSRESFLKKDAEGCARELRNGAEIFARIAREATDETVGLLEGSARELKKLADDVANGTIGSVEALDHAFARAHHALAMHYHDTAHKAYANHELRRAGHALSASVRAFEYAVKWSGHTLEAGVKLTIDSALMLSGKLIEGAGFVTKEAGKIVADIGYEVEKFGTVIDPYTKN